MRTKILHFMKKTYLLLLAACLPVVSCDYLEKPKGTDITEDSIFSTQNNIETFVTGTYYYGVVSDYTYLDSHNNGGGGYSPCCDEGEITMPWYWQHQWNNGAISASNIFDGKWNLSVGLAGNLHWLAIRRANTILKHMDNLDFTPEPGFVERVKGEAYWIRAWNYFELMRKYGGVPILEDPIDASDPSSFKVPRSPLKDVIDFIAGDCDRAIDMLEGRYDVYPGDQHGRVTTGAAYALKSRTLLYAASPLMQNDLTSTVEKPYDKDLCLEAARAAQECLEFIRDNDTGRRFTTGTIEPGTIDAYKGIFVLPTTTFCHEEYLWWDRRNMNEEEQANTLRKYWIWADLDTFTGQDAAIVGMPTANIVAYYERKGPDGNYYPITDERSGYVEGEWSSMQDRDPRFYNNLLLPGTKWGKKQQKDYYVTMALQKIHVA